MDEPQPGAAAHEVSITLEYSIGQLKDRSKARRQHVLLKAAPQIAEHYRKLSTMSLRGLEDVDEAVRAEALDFYNAVIADGRFVALLETDPRSAAESLEKRVSSRALDVISEINTQIGGPVEGPVEAVIAVAVVIVLAPKIPAEGIVIDELATVRARL